jgi:hypothetical protein
VIVRYQTVDGFEVRTTPEIVAFAHLVQFTLVGAAFGNERRQREFTLEFGELEKLLAAQTVECGPVVKLRFECIQGGLHQDASSMALAVEETGETFVYLLTNFMYSKLYDVLEATLKASI